ncbi:MAG: TIGR00159 family protein [Calditrichaeota bacterium]|nr:MAG: TIGR00159 family protein [Calditrichota bacterium]MBL1207593.1 TIGR00159 family protein [Calditrichota bacterium]NOG47426.1 TIGR00159 family protein [Calditrichota bacterium]
MIFKVGFLPVTIFDVVDILIVSAIIFKLYQFLKGGVAIRMFIGLLLIVVFSVVGDLLNMSALSWMMSSLKTVWVLAFVIVFQPELRRLLIYLGQNRIIRQIVRVDELRFIDQIVNATLDLSKKNYGALIVLLKDMNIKSILESGIAMQAKLSEQLLISVFNPRSPLHDGAVVVQNDIVLAAKCLLPLSQNPDIDPSLGTRHRAALGLSEQTDAFVVIVSEETGMVSYAENGKIVRGLTENLLRKKLDELFSPRAEDKAGWRFGILANN